MIDLHHTGRTPPGGGPGPIAYLSRQTGFAMRLEAVILPELGTGPDVPIVISHWFAGRGKRVEEGDRLVELLVGPATFDISAPRTGRLAEIRGREDDHVRPGAVLAYLAIADDDDRPGRRPPDGPGRRQP